MVVGLGKSGAEVARDLGLNQSTVQQWVANWRRDHDGKPGVPGPVEVARLAELEERNRRLEQENLFLNYEEFLIIFITPLMRSVWLCEAACPRPWSGRCWRPGRSA
jgi:transposase-like protein